MCKKGIDMKDTQGIYEKHMKKEWVSVKIERKLYVIGLQTGKNRVSNKVSKSSININANTNTNQKSIDMINQCKSNVKKYQTLSFEYRSNGDMVYSELYGQYAEHYQRSMNSLNIKMSSKKNSTEGSKKKESSKLNKCNDGDSKNVKTCIKSESIVE